LDRASHHIDIVTGAEPNPSLSWSFDSRTKAEYSCRDNAAKFVHYRDKDHVQVVVALVLTPAQEADP